MAASLSIAGCTPSTVEEAEKKADVAWLDDRGDEDSVAALGRLADANANAVERLRARSATDHRVFAVAWDAHTRGAAWGTTLLHDAIRDPARFERASAALPPGDQRTAPFATDLSDAMTSGNYPPDGTVSAATVLSAVGSAAHAIVEARLEDERTRASMCRGLGAGWASTDATATLRAKATIARDTPACTAAIARIASVDETTLTWLAKDADPPLLGAASGARVMPCDDVRQAWTLALSHREEATYSALAVPLRSAATRCGDPIDQAIFDALGEHPKVADLVVEAYHPAHARGIRLKKSCERLARIAQKMKSEHNRERAALSLRHACDRS